VYIPELILFPAPLTVNSW